MISLLLLGTWQILLNNFSLRSAFNRCPKRNPIKELLEGEGRRERPALKAFRKLSFLLFNIL